VVTTPVDLINQKGVITSLEAAQDFLAIPDQLHEIAISFKDSAKIENQIDELKRKTDLSSFDVKPWMSLAF
jgi:ABC-type lipoprotein release transport system permease subunit